MTFGSGYGEVPKIESRRNQEATEFVMVRRSEIAIDYCDIVQQSLIT